MIQRSFIFLICNYLSLVGIYRQFKLWPGQSHEGELNKIIAIIKGLSSSKTLVVGGDFNLDWHRKLERCFNFSKYVSLVEEWADEYNLSQIIHSTTRHRTVNRAGKLNEESSCLDLVFVSNLNLVCNGTIPGICSDHDVVFAAIDSPKV